MDKIVKGTATKTHVTTFLHCSDKDYISMIPKVEGCLNARGISATASLGSDSMRQLITDIVKELLDDSQFHEMLHWTMVNGQETQDNVERALACGVRNIHNARKRRGGRAKSETMEEDLPAPEATSTTQTIESRALDTLPSSPATTTHSTIHRPQTGLDFDLMLATFPADPRTANTLDNRGKTYTIAIPKALDSTEKFKYLHERIRTIIKDDAQDFWVSETVEGNQECICDDAVTFDALLGENTSRAARLRLNVFYTQGIRSSKSKHMRVRYCHARLILATSYHFNHETSTDN